MLQICPCVYGCVNIALTFNLSLFLSLCVLRIQYQILIWFAAVARVCSIAGRVTTADKLLLIPEIQIVISFMFA